jgi:PadR family transcriptional regulator, regulatory protein PadR
MTTPANRPTETDPKAANKLDRELIRGAGPLAVLKLLERREMYGYELVEELDRATGGILAMGQSTLYPMLYNLEAQGLVECSWREATTGRERKYYRLTSSGKERLADDTAQFGRLTLALGKLGVLPSASFGQDGRLAMG